MSVLEECRNALGSPNVAAFLRLIRAGETSQEEGAYREMFGGGLFDSFDDHPRRAITRGTLTSTAAGAYQFLSRTWDECRDALHLPDFSPPMQDLAAVFLIRRRGALADVLAGRIEQAIGRCAKEWASLPGSPYGQPTRTLAQALATYAQYGGALAGPATTPSPAPIPAPAAPIPAAPAPTHYAPAGEAGEAPELTAIPPELAPQPAAEGKPMADIPSAASTIAQAAGGILSSGVAGPVGMLAGVLIKAFSPLAKEKLENVLERHTDHPEVAQQVAASIVDAAVAATSKADPFEAVMAAKSDPAAVQQVESSALSKLTELAPLLEKLAALDAQAWRAEEDSRDAGATRGRADAEDMAPQLADRAFKVYMVVIVATVIAMVVQMIVAKDGKPSGELIGFFIAVAMLGARQWETLFQYRFGSSRGSSAKDVVIQQMQQRRGKP